MIAMPATAPTAPVLSMPFATKATRLVSDSIVAPFTERPAIVRVKCARRSPRVITCRVHLIGDRLDARMRVRARRTSDGGVLIFASNFRPEA